MAERAREHPDARFIGLDPNHAGLIEMSRRLMRSRRAVNCHFVLGSVEELPGTFQELANSVTVLFPWGSLLRAVAAPVDEDIERFAGLCAEGAAIDIVTAIDTEADKAELSRLGLAGFSVERMADCWSRGFHVAAVEPLESDHEYQTTWWRKIRQRETRQAVRLSLRKPEQP
ncbi:MAG: hypothetical protein AB7N24_11395 [Dehalococcoidia bacterium]